MSAMLRVLLVDDDPLVRTGLRYLPGGASGIVVAGEAGGGDEVPAAVADTRPHVVLMDLRMGRVGGVQATATLRSEPDPPAVVALTTFDTDDEIIGALRAGAAGYLLKVSSQSPERSPSVSPTLRSPRVNTSARPRSRPMSRAPSPSST